MTPLAQKLHIKPGKRWLIYNAPAGYLESLRPLPKDAVCMTSPEGSVRLTNPKGHFDGIQLFAKNKSELSYALKVIGPLLKPDTIFWIAYPKKSSGIDSDMKMGDWDELAAFHLQGVASIAVDDRWAGSRFRPVGQSKISGTAKEEIRNSEYAAYIDVDKKTITLPPEIKRLLRQDPSAQNFFEQLSYSNKKEYLLWIFMAKQEKTRQDRLEKMIQKLRAGKKNPAEK